jgi:polyferredoxin
LPRRFSLCATAHTAQLLYLYQNYCENRIIFEIRQEKNAMIHADGGESWFNRRWCEYLNKVHYFLPIGNFATTVTQEVQASALPAGGLHEGSQI